MFEICKNYDSFLEQNEMKNCLFQKMFVLLQFEEKVADLLF